MASGSKGNATYIEHNNVKILIDVGISFKRIKDAMSSHGFDIFSVTHVFITHEHVDHIKGIETLYKNIKAPIYITEGTAKSMNMSSNPLYKDHLQLIEPLEPFFLEDMEIIPFPLSHDARDPIGFIIKADDKKISFITDTGYIREGLIPLLSNADLYYMEANHDPYLLKNSPRPYHTIRRILTEKGHLSNEDSAYYFSQMMGDQTKKIIMAHISEECNTVDIIKRTYEDVMLAHHKDFNELTVYYASQEPLEVIEL